tara:strand:+ start:928 stop:1212 length:285 start_codon:yes stop_codon:yes gene_type:complete
MKLDDYINEAVDNIRNDRETTKELLNDAINYMSNKADAHETVGQIAAKYVETLQRSNEQLVKVMGLLQKRENTSDALSENDKKELFDLISSGEV